MIRRMYLDGTEKLEARRIIKEKTGYVIRSTSILNQVFRRSSFAAETGQNSNEIFEFQGDQVLSFYVTRIISKRCGSLSLTDDYTFRIRENRFTQIIQTLVIAFFSFSHLDFIALNSSRSSANSSFIS